MLYTHNRLDHDLSLVVDGCEAALAVHGALAFDTIMAVQTSGSRHPSRLQAKSCSHSGCCLHGVVSNATCS